MGAPGSSCCVCCGCARCGGAVCASCRKFKLRLPRQPADPRDRVWHATAAVHRAEDVPARVILEGLPAPLDQKQFAMCAINACATAINYAMSRRGVTGFCASRMFLYYNTRRYVMKMKSLEDSGCNMRDTCKALAMFGACPEAMWPYKSRLLRREPPAEVYRAARQVLPRCKYEAVPQSLNHMLPCLVHHHPILMGMAVFSNVRRLHEDGEMPMPGPGDTLLGVHAVAVCGYDLATNRFAAMNCWGGGWGDAGVFYIPFEFALNPTLCWDLWILNIQE
jgi:hypothetical protein